MARRAGEADLETLLKRVAARDRRAFALLYQQTNAKLYGVAVRIARHDAAADVLQETYLRIWRKAGDYDPSKGSPMSWMATIARNRVLDAIRRAKPTAIEHLDLDTPKDTQPVSSRDRSEQLEALMRCLLQLDIEQREVLLLAYYRGASREALAKRFERPVPTIKTWLRRSLAQIKTCLAKQGE